MWDLVSSTLPGQQLSLGMAGATWHHALTHIQTHERRIPICTLLTRPAKRGGCRAGWKQTGGEGGGTQEPLLVLHKERSPVWRKTHTPGERREKKEISNNDTCDREAKRGVPNSTHTTSSSSTTRCFASSPDQQAPERAKASHLKQSRYDKNVPPFLVVLAGSRLTPSCGRPPMRRHGKWGRCGCP